MRVDSIHDSLNPQDAYASLANLASPSATLMAALPFEPACPLASLVVAPRPIGDPSAAPLDLGRLITECTAPGGHALPSTRLKKSAGCCVGGGESLTECDRIVARLVEGRSPTSIPAPERPEKASRRRDGGLSGTRAAPCGSWLWLLLVVVLSGERAAAELEGTSAGRSLPLSHPPLPLGVLALAGESEAPYIGLPSPAGDAAVNSMRAAPPLVAMLGLLRALRSELGESTVAGRLGSSSHGEDPRLCISPGVPGRLLRFPRLCISPGVPGRLLRFPRLCISPGVPGRLLVTLLRLLFLPPFGPPLAEQRLEALATC